jgi:hypothetical protein
MHVDSPRSMPKTYMPIFFLYCIWPKLIVGAQIVGHIVVKIDVCTSIQGLTLICNMNISTCIKNNSIGYKKVMYPSDICSG